MSFLKHMSQYKWHYIGAIVLLFAINGSFFTIDQTDMGNIRRLGSKLYAQPLGPGLHFKLPFIDTPDKIQVTLNTVVIEPFDVSTIDNQVVTISINYNYTIPSDQVNHLLYEVGGMGDDQTNIHAQAIAVAKDRASAIFAGQNMVTVNANRAAIQAAITASVHERLRSLFGIEPHSLQLPEIKPSPQFLASNAAAVNAKNAAVAAENTKRTKQFEADQVVITAKGAADAAIEEARGASQSAKLNADGEKYRLLAQADGLRAEVSAFGSPAEYVEYIRSGQGWNGVLPTTTYGSVIPFVNVKP
jgi:membrane protease subunit HflC